MREEEGEVGRMGKGQRKKENDRSKGMIKEKVGRNKRKEGRKEGGHSLRVGTLLSQYCSTLQNL